MPTAKVYVSIAHEDNPADRRWFAPGDDVPDEYASTVANRDAVFGDGTAEAPSDAVGDDDADAGTDTPGDDDAADAAVEPADDDDADEGDDDAEDLYDDMTNDELRAELVRRDLSASGNKATLVERLREDDADYDGDDDDV